MPTSEHRRFAADIQRFAKKLDVDVGLATRRVALQVFTGIVQKTPVDTGRARSNWAIALGGPASTPSSAITEEHQRQRKENGEGVDPSSITDQAVREAEASSMAINGQQLVYISNNLPYISRLNEGHSQQAPAGFVEATLAEVAREIISATEDLES